MAQGSAFPVKWQVCSPCAKLSRAGWTPEGLHSARLTVTSATSALCPEHESPSDSGLATLLHCGESHVPVLICSAQKCPFCTAPKGIGQCSARKRRYQATQFKETEDSRCLEKKKSPCP